MNLSAMSSLKQVWGSVSRREQRLLLGLAGFVLMTLAFTFIWQPTRQRLAIAERLYQQQVELSVRIQRAQPPLDMSAASRPLSVRANDSATKAGLEIEEMSIDGDSVQMVVGGEANALLDWLDRSERDGAMLQSLTLQARDGRLEARVMLR
ncbi:type II secretion system protein GspM [Pseudomonas sp. T1.Ur]|uniref:type II secretion system protein GspM n=1 Tax=Pseudomonas sp. T1.Ur TaxID=2928704 RepID=UPI00201DB98B|nr:type II secretion system protein GspM [Pseudomonas sp. T1.Ur]MCL6704239.1 type II secretion system protein M [Pseudomonas sp. T1.Ur]